MKSICMLMQSSPSGHPADPAASRSRTRSRCGLFTRLTSPHCCGSSARLLVTTYQAGKLVLVREEGDHLNTHFRTFQAPMGMALSGDRLAVGTRLQVWEYVDVPAVTAKLDPPGRHDACFLPPRATSRATSRSMRWRGAPAVRSGLSTPGFRASARSTARLALCPNGGRRLSVRSSPRTAVI